MIVIFVFLAVILFCVLLLAKNINTFKQHELIGTAVRDYHLDLIRRGAHDTLTDFPVDYDDMEPYECTLLRLWDWGLQAYLAEG